MKILSTTVILTICMQLALIAPRNVEKLIQKGAANIFPHQQIAKKLLTDKKARLP